MDQSTITTPDRSPPRTPPGTRADYTLFLPVTTRWMDNDSLGHLNNVVYYSLFDTAVCHRFVQAGILYAPGSPHLLMMVESGCRYHSEVRFPDPLTTGVRLAQLGRSSIRHEIALFRDTAEVASAEGFMVHVCVDAATRRPAPMPDAWRIALQS